MKLPPDTIADLLARPGVTDAYGRPLDTSPPARLFFNPTEKEFMQAVRDLALSLGWKVYHTHDSRRSESGFPDLILLRHRCIAAELKVGNNKATAPQLSWLEAFTAAGCTAKLWTPECWSEIVATLTATE